MRNKLGAVKLRLGPVWVSIEQFTLLIFAIGRSHLCVSLRSCIFSGFFTIFFNHAPRYLISRPCNLASFNDSKYILFCQRLV